jgi:hypothetical protein
MLILPRKMHFMRQISMPAIPDPVKKSEMKFSAVKIQAKAKAEDYTMVLKTPIRKTTLRHIAYPLSFLLNLAMRGRIIKNTDTQILLALLIIPADYSLVHCQIGGNLVN